MVFGNCWIGLGDGEKAILDDCNDSPVSMVLSLAFGVAIWRSLSLSLSHISPSLVIIVDSAVETTLLFLMHRPFLRITPSQVSFLPKRVLFDSSNELLSNSNEVWIENKK